MQMIFTWERVLIKAKDQYPFLKISWKSGIEKKRRDASLIIKSQNPLKPNGDSININSIIRLIIYTKLATLNATQQLQWVILISKGVLSGWILHKT